MFTLLHRMLSTSVILAAITAITIAYTRWVRSPCLRWSSLTPYIGHSQREHSTSHGSMSNAIWFIHGNDDDEINVEGRRYAAGDSGAPLLCSLVCKSLGRHIHVDPCRSNEAGVCGGGSGVQHIPDSTRRAREDLVTHRVFWQRSGWYLPVDLISSGFLNTCVVGFAGEFDGHALAVE